MLVGRRLGNFVVRDADGFQVRPVPGAGFRLVGET